MNDLFFEALPDPMRLSGISTTFLGESGFTGWESVNGNLMQFAQLHNAYELLESVFDIKDHWAARTMLDEWREGVFNQLPRISVLTDVEMQGALGGYSSEFNTIFLSNTVTRYDSITGQVLLEEYGHHLDARLNPESDTEGDEGELFSAVVLKKNLSEQTYHRIKNEDDTIQIALITGECYRVEASTQVTLSEHAEYKGAAKSFGIGNHAFVGNDFNDRATSIAIPSGSGLVAEVFEHANFQGRSTVVSFSQMSIGADWSDSNFKVSHLNDQTSSIIVRQRRSDEIIFFQHGNFQGLAYSDVIGGKSQIRFNDDCSSIDLPEGVGIEVFEHASFAGRSQIFMSDVSSIGLLNDQISSYRTFPLSSTYRIDSLNSDGNESHRHTFKIFRTGNTAVAGQVRFSTSSDSATSDVDFSSYTAVRNFSPGQTEDTVYVDSRTDNVNEGTERFNATISKVNNNDTITTASTFGQIFNVNPASSYRVDRLNSDGNEGHRHTFKIFRTGNTAVAGQVRFSTSSDSATSDVDFSSYTDVRNFAPGQTEDTVYVDSRTDYVNEGTERFNATISKVNNDDTITTASTFGQIFNVDTASSYRLDRLNSDGNEGNRHTFKIFRTGNTAVSGQVRFSTAGDSATSDVDFSSYTAVRNFAPGQTEDVVYVDSRIDNVNEGTERFNVSISKVNNADTITTASTFGQIFNVDTASSYRVDRLNSDGNEGNRHTFKIFRTGHTAVAGQVRFSTAGDSATSGVDFSSYSAVRNFAPGQTEDVVYVDSRTDNVNEGTERFNVSISKVNNADTITMASTFGQIFNDNSINGSTTVNDQNYQWNISRFNQDGKIDAPFDFSKTTVVVSHGRVKESGEPVSNLEQLAKTAAKIFGDAVQVLFLDWRSASADPGEWGSSRPTEAGKRIGAIADDVYRNLYDIGLTQAGNLYFYGHSLGSLLLSKVAERYGRIAGFVSLDPAFTAEDYDLDNDGNTLEDELPDLNSIASSSIALVAEDIPVIGAAGDNNYAMTAHRSYIVDFANGSLSGLGSLNGLFKYSPTKFHNAVVDVFSGMLRSGLEINWLATASNLRVNQWGQDGRQKQGNSVGNYYADGVIGANFLNNDSDLYVDNLIFIDADGKRVARRINQNVRRT